MANAHTPPPTHPSAANTPPPLTADLHDADKPPSDDGYVLNTPPPPRATHPVPLSPPWSSVSPLASTASLALPSGIPVKSDRRRTSVTFANDSNSKSKSKSTSNLVATNAPPPPHPDAELKRYHSVLSKTDLLDTHKRTNKSPPARFLGNKLQSLRKKIENELSRKRPGRSGGQDPAAASESRFGRRHKRQNQKGTVAGLRPSPALTVPEAMSVADASQLCAAKRTDCVLVVDDDEGLSGIFTAKDLAFRVTAEGLDPRNTTVAQIMTRNPMVTRDTTSATEALQLMVSRHFRHLPVCNEDGDVVGLLDITKVFHDALGKVERSADATNQLSAALAGVQTELGTGLAADPQAMAMMAYVDALRDRMSQPDVMSVLDTSLPPPTVSPRTSVREAARLMKERRTTAVCVLEVNHGSMISSSSSRDQPPKIAGIFTSKDIVLRVIAAGLDAARCSVVRVMTPHPDTAPPTMTIQNALKKMHNGHYLNLPVVEDDGRLIGIVDVLKLTYATLEQIDQMSEDRGTEGPMWGKFFDTLNTAGPEDDSVSGISASDQVSESPSKSMHSRGLSSVTSPMSDVMPGDSASVVNDNTSEVGQGSSLAAQAPIEDGTYVFKFKTPSGRTHRFQARHDNFDNLHDIVHGKLMGDPFFDTPTDPTAFVPDPSVFTLSYTDDDGDLVEITADGDVTDAVRIARGRQLDRVVLNLSGGKNWNEALRDRERRERERTLTPPAEEKQHPEPRLEKIAEEEVKPIEVAPAPPVVPVEAHPVPVAAARAPVPEELVFGVLPKDLALPAAIGFLGVVIVGVFVASRTSK